MQWRTAEAVDDRREDVRLPGTGLLTLAVLSASGARGQVLPPVEVLNLSAGGVAVVSGVGVPHGTRLEVLEAAAAPGAPTPAGPSCRLEVLDACAWTGRRHLLRCRVAEGRLPAGIFMRY